MVKAKSETKVDKRLGQPQRDADGYFTRKPMKVYNKKSDLNRWCEEEDFEDEAGDHLRHLRYSMLFAGQGVNRAKRVYDLAKRELWHAMQKHHRHKCVAPPAWRKKFAPKNKANQPRPVMRYVHEGMNTDSSTVSGDEDSNNHESALWYGLEPPKFNL